MESMTDYTPEEFEALERENRRLTGQVAALEYQIDVLRYEKGQMCSVSEALRAIPGVGKYVFSLRNGDFSALPPLRTELSGVWARGYRKGELGSRILRLHSADVTIMELVPVVKLRLERAHSPKTYYLAKKAIQRESASEPNLTKD